MLVLVPERHQNLLEIHLNHPPVPHQNHDLQLGRHPVMR